MNEMKWFGGFEETQQMSYFDDIAATTDFQLWYFGHYHMDRTWEKFTC